MLRTDNQYSLIVWLWGIKKFFTDFFFFSFGVNVSWNKAIHFSLRVINFLIIFKINRPSVNANFVIFICTVSTFNSGNIRENSVFWQISKSLLIYPYIFIQWVIRLSINFPFSPVNQLSASSTFLCLSTKSEKLLSFSLMVKIMTGKSLGHLGSTSASCCTSCGKVTTCPLAASWFCVYMHYRKCSLQ